MASIKPQPVQPQPPRSASAGTKETNIQVAVRCRPRNAQEDDNLASAVEISGNNEVNVKVRQGAKFDTKTYSFDKVFGPDASQVDVYQSLVAPLLDEVLAGYNCTVFAYGQTGTGKTHTMEGYRTDAQISSYTDDPGCGIIPRALHHLFELLEGGDVEFTVRVSFLEIYNEELFDLLSPTDDHTKLRLFEDVRNKGSVVIQGLEEIHVQNKNEVYHILHKGAEKRRTSETKMNKNSSRSHSVFMVTVHQKEPSVDGEELLKTGKLYLVDLAGSENIGRSGAMKDRAREAGNINQSLLTLGRVIKKLEEKDAHIPFRESKLTRLLQDSLGGKTKTSIIATISPAMCNLEETLSTLDYAFHARAIKNRPEINQKLTKKMLIKEYTDEIDRLKRDLAASRDKNGIYVSQENYEEMQLTLEGQKQRIKELSDNIATLTAEMEKIKQVFEETSAELTSTKQELVVTSENLAQTRCDLEQTTTQLEHTTLERDQTQYVADSHAGTATVLSAQAQKLLQVTETTVQHVAGLHSKIDRKAAVEAHNLSASASFQQGQSARVGDCLQSMTSFEQQQAAVLQDIRQRMNQALSSQDQHCRQIQSTYQAMTESFKATVSDSAKNVGDMQKACQSSFASAVQRVGGCFDSSNTAVQEFFSTFSKEFFAPLQLQIEQQQSQLEATFQALHNQLEMAETNIKDFVNLHTAALQQLEDDVAATMKSHATAAEHRAEAFRQQAARRQEVLASSLTAMQQQFATIVTAFQQEQEQGLARDCQENMEQAKTEAQQLSSDSQRWQQRVQSQSSDVAQFQAGVLAHLSNTSSASDVAAKTLNQQAQGVHQLVDGSQQLLQQLTSKLNQQHQQAQAAITADLGREETTFCNQLQEFQSSVESTMDSANQQILAAQTIQQDSSAELQSYHQAQTQAWEAAEANTTAVVGAVQGHLAQMVEDTNTFVQAEMKRDVPTGTTPARQVYDFPRKFVSLRDREDLVREFSEARQAVVTESSVEETSCQESEDQNMEVYSAEVTAESADISPTAEPAPVEAPSEGETAPKRKRINSKLPMFSVAPSAPLKSVNQ